MTRLDSSRPIEFTRRMQAPDCPPEQRVQGMRAVSCLRFDTPFQTPDGLDRRQKQLEAHRRLLERIGAFFRGGDAPAAGEETLEVLALLEAADRALRTGAEEAVQTGSPTATWASSPLSTRAGPSRLSAAASCPRRR